jgi:hypothetical protein
MFRGQDRPLEHSYASFLQVARDVFIDLTSVRVEEESK